MKRLVFCFDGTSNRLIVENPTNVVLTAESVLPLANDQKTAQLIFYDDRRSRLRGDAVRFHQVTAGNRCLAASAMIKSRPSSGPAMLPSSAMLPDPAGLELFAFGRANGSNGNIFQLLLNFTGQREE